jgi:hypothetical protein
MKYHKFQKLFFTFFLLFSLFSFFFFTFHPTQAVSISDILWNGVSNECQPTCEDLGIPKEKCGNCTLRDALQLAVNIGKLILQFLGVAALIAFIYGGLLWITSGGKSEQINQGKRVLTGALIGIVIVVFAYTIVYNIMKWVGAPGKIEEYLPGAEEQKGDCFETWPNCGSFPWTKDCKSDLVKSVQQKLNEKKCGNLSVDGCFGPATRNAVKNFQNANGLQVTGQLNQETYDKLFGTSNSCAT